MSGAFQLSFTVPGQPVPWARAARDKRSGRTFTKRPQIAHKLEAQRQAVKAMKAEGLERIPPGVPVHMLAAFHYALPESITGAEAERRLSGSAYHTQTPDCDNLLKLIKDALNGIVYHDDCQVASVSVSKYWTITGTSESRIVITSPYNLTGH